MDKSNFNKVIEFIKTAGQPVNKTPTMPRPGLAALRLNLITEELQELYNAVLSDSSLSQKINELFDTIRSLTVDINHPDQIKLCTTETPDALGDILYVVYGAGATFGFDLDDYFADIHESNMSKFDTSYDDVIETISKYQAGTHPDKLGVTINDLFYREIQCNGRLLYPTVMEKSGKILKSHKYKSVQQLRTEKGKIAGKAYLD